MQAIALGPIKSSQSSAAKQLRVNETSSGFSILETQKSMSDPTYIAEMAFKLAGVLIIPAGGIVMFLPLIVAGPAGLISHVSMLAAFVFVGVSLHRWADKGFRRKVQFNIARQEMCIGTLNANGNFHQQSVYSVDKIESFFIVRSKDRGTPASLQMRLKAGAKTMRVFDGPEGALVPILERITLAFRPPQQSNRRIQTKTNGRFIRVSFE